MSTLIRAFSGDADDLSMLSASNSKVVFKCGLRTSTVCVTLPAIMPFSAVTIQGPVSDTTATISTTCVIAVVTCPFDTAFTSGGPSDATPPTFCSPVTTHDGASNATASRTTPSNAPLMSIGEALNAWKSVYAMLPSVDRPLSAAITFGSTCSTTAALLTTLLTAATVCKPESSVSGRLLATTTTSKARPSGSPS